MPRSLALVACLLLAGCFSIPSKPLDVELYRFDGTQLVGCSLATGWTVDETKKRCGAPIGKVDLSGQFGGDCLIYNNHAQALRSDIRPAPYVALCFSQGANIVDTNTGRPISRSGPVLVSAIGLASVPPEVLAK